MDHIFPIEFFAVSTILIYFGMLFAFFGGYIMQKVSRYVPRRLFDVGSIIMYLSDLTFASSVIVHTTDGKDMYFGIGIFAFFSFFTPAFGFILSKYMDDKNEVKTIR